MRLLEVASFASHDVRPKLVEFFGSNIPPYAILSHTWTDDEVLYDHIKNGATRTKRAFPKILFAIEQTQRDGWEYLWVDTCCIDKSSSAELQEAINSMYTWYSRAERCYAYLEDVAPENPRETSGDTLAASRWFTRGWTLQELLAPREVYFYSRDWHRRGIVNTKVSENDLFVHLISRVTRIATKYLTDPDQLKHASVATRMSWASRRECTREEDLAYSLLGIFDVNMPLLYGEGSKAYLRLQEEILRRSDDTSIFLWTHDRADYDKPFQGLLAPSPACFKKSSMVKTASITNRAASQPYSMTNKGLQVQLPLKRISHGVYLAILDCDRHAYGDEATVPGILLRRIVSRSNQFARICCDKIVRSSALEPAVKESFFVRQDPEASGWVDVLRHARRSSAATPLEWLGTSHSVRIQLSPRTKECFHALQYATFINGTLEMLDIHRTSSRSDVEPDVLHLRRSYPGTNLSSGIILYENHTNNRLIVLLGSPSPPFLRFGAYFPDLADYPDLDLRLQTVGTEILYGTGLLRYRITLATQIPSTTDNHTAAAGHALQCLCPRVTACCNRDRCHELTLDVDCHQRDQSDNFVNPDPPPVLVPMGAAQLERYALPMLPNYVPLAANCPVHIVSGPGGPRSI